MSEAAFEICDLCQKHGRIIGADGFVGVEFCDQEHASRIIETALDFKILTHKEAKRISKEVQDSKLPLSFDKTDPELQWKAEFFNLLRIEMGYIIRRRTPERIPRIHALLQKDPQVPMPSDFIETAKKRLQGLKKKGN